MQVVDDITWLINTWQADAADLHMAEQAKAVRPNVATTVRQHSLSDSSYTDCPHFPRKCCYGSFHYSVS